MNINLICFLFRQLIRLLKMYKHFNLSISLMFAIFYVMVHHNSKTDAASCKGTLIFHWREIGNKRATGKKNWTTQSEEMFGNKNKLSIFITPETTFGFTIKGNCCWDVYPENGYKGQPIKLKSKLPNGFGTIPGHPKFIANSLKKVPCEV